MGFGKREKEGGLRPFVLLAFLISLELETGALTRHFLSS